MNQENYEIQIYHKITFAVLLYFVDQQGIVGILRH